MAVKGSVLVLGLVLLHIFAYPLKFTQPLLKHLLMSILQSTFVESWLDNLHYSMAFLTVMLIYYIGWLYYNPGLVNPFQDVMYDDESYDWDDARFESLPFNKGIDIVKECIGNNWKQLARELGFSETDIDDIEGWNRSIKEQVYQLFYEWQRKKGNYASLTELKRALVAARPNLDEEKIQALIRRGVYTTKTMETKQSLQLPDWQPRLLVPVDEPCGLEFIAEKSNGDFPWRGLKVRLPPGPADLTIRVCSSGHIRLPKNTELVSPLYYICFTGEWSHSYDLEAEIQHAACLLKDSHCSRLQFVVAKLPQDSLSYQLSPYTENTRVSMSPTSGCIRLPCSNSHCGYLIGIVKPRTRFWIFASNIVRSRYYLRALLSSVNDNECRIHLVIVKDLDPYIQLIDDRYPPEKFDSCGEVKKLSLLEHSPLGQSRITLSSVTSLSKEWKVISSSPTTILRSKLESLESYTKANDLPVFTVSLQRDNTESSSSSESASTLPSSNLKCQFKFGGTASPFSCPSFQLPNWTDGAN